MHIVEAKGILSAKNGMNLYRGCSHGCIYCDSRSSVYHMDHDFEDMQLFHHTCEKNGIVHDNRKIFEYLSTFETKCDNVQLSLFDKDFAGKSPNGI